MEGDESPFRVVFERGLATVRLTLAEEGSIAGLLISELLAIADPGAWEHVAFEEAGEPGVLDLTTWLRGADGTSVCVLVTQNRLDDPLHELRTATLYRGLLAARSGVLGMSLVSSGTTLGTTPIVVRGR